MKGNVTRVSGRAPAMAQPHRVPSAPSIKGQMVKVTGSHISAAGGFTASRKAGSVRGSHSVK